jgi:transcriptional regulator with XRE-family HTH domain
MKDSIRKIRTSLGLSQHQFAIKCHVTTQTVGKWERGEGGRPSHLAMAQLQKAAQEAGLELNGTMPAGPKYAAQGAKKPVVEPVEKQKLLDLGEQKTAEAKGGSWLSKISL